jgi:hypothetical protein
MSLRLSRRDWLRLAAAGVGAVSVSGWLDRLAADSSTHPDRKRSCILLWMSGGAAQTDTFDPKPDHPNGGPYKPQTTAVPGMQIGEHLPRLARHADRLAIVRSMTTKEGDHERATYYLRTGYLPGTPVQYPAFGSLMSKELADDASDLPGFVSISPYKGLVPAAYGPGFLGPGHAPLIVGDEARFGNPVANYEKSLKVQDVQTAKDLGKEEVSARLDLLQGMERQFLSQHSANSVTSHLAAYDRAVRLMSPAAAKAFNLDDELPALRDRYGRNMFGQGCLLARRLVERGVPFVEVTLGPIPGVPEGWDTHSRNFDQVAKLCAVLDPAWATLMDDLDQRGLLDSTLILYMSEFGRTPRINQEKGRDHFPNAWSTVMGGGGIQGGSIVGKTTRDGMTVDDKPVSVPTFLATVCKAMGVDPMKQNPSNVGRPIRIADPTAKPIEEVLA